jgi:hypothetical protein
MKVNKESGGNKGCRKQVLAFRQSNNSCFIEAIIQEVYWQSVLVI